MSDTSFIPFRRRLASVTRLEQASSVGALAFAVWVTAAVAVGILRGGQLLEIALIGVAGLLAWSAAAPVLRRRSAALVAVACFVAPLGNAWPARIWAHAVEQVLPAGGWLLGNTSSLLLIAAFVVARPRRPVGVPRLAVGAAVLLVVGALLSTTLAGLPESGLEAIWVGLVVPIAWAALAAGWVRTAAEAVVCLTALVAGALVPLAMGVAAYVLEFGVPGSGADLVRVKMELYRPFLIQDATLGNVGHIASLAVLVLLAGIVLAGIAAVATVGRCAACVSGSAAVAVLALVLERGAIFVALATLVVVGLALARVLGRAAVPAALAVVLLLGLSALPSVRTYVGASLPTIDDARPDTAETPPDDGPKVEVTPDVVIDVGDTSADVRVSAASTAVDVFADHAPFGVGTGQYRRYDPEHTAAHSLPLQILAEDGVVGLAGFLLLAAAVVTLAVRTLRRAGGWRPLRVAAATAGIACSGAFLVHASLVGTTFATDGVNVLGLAFWLSLALGICAVETSE